MPKRTQEPSLEEELARVKAIREGQPQAEPEVTRMPKGISHHAEGKALFPLKNRYLKKIKSLSAKGNANSYEANGLRLAHKERLQNAASKSWVLKGKEVDRYTMMKYIIETLSSGTLLIDICDGTPGMPSVSTVYTWQKEHPDFGKAMKMAKEVQAQYFADKGLKAVTEEYDPKSAALAKNKHDAYLKRAALQSPDFRERQAAPPEPDVPQDLESMQARLMELIQANPDVLPPGMREALQASLGPKAVLSITLTPSGPIEEVDPHFTLEDPDEGEDARS